MQKKVKITELFTHPSSELYTVAILNFGSEKIKLYSNKELENKIKLMFYKNNNTKPFAKKISAMIDNKTIIPCWSSNRGLIKFLFKKLFNINETHQLAGVGSFFELSNNKIFLLLDNNTNIFTHVNEDILSTITIHELCHYLYVNNFNITKSYFHSKVKEFYSNYFNYLFQTNTLNEFPLTNEILKILIKNDISNNFNFNTFKTKMNNILTASGIEEYSSLNKESIQIISNLYIVITYLYLKNINELYNLIERNAGVRKIISLLYQTYRETFGFNPSSIFCVQELLFPSEVIALYASYSPEGRSKFKQVINST